MPGNTPDSRLVTTAGGLRELVRRLREAGRFAFDTEFVSEDSFEPDLCLIQVATADHLAVVDPQTVGDLGPFWEVVNDPAVEVVMHAGGEDLRICRIRSGQLPARVVDVQIAAGLVGHSFPLSLTNLARQELGETLHSGETRTDWRRRPLTDSQLRYALDDVRHLLAIADQLGARLAGWGRAAWAEAEYRELLTSVEARTDDPERWRRLPGLNQLSRRGLECARRLFDWRLEQARRGDRPVRQVLRDDLLVAIAKRQPAHVRDLEALRDFQRPHLLAKSHEILRVIAEAKAVPEADLPEHGERRDDPPGVGMVVGLLAASLQHCCAEARVAASLVGSQSDLRDLIRWQQEGAPGDSAPALATGWRAAVCGTTLSDVLAGRRALRIVDPMSEAPVALVPLDGEADATGP